MPLKKGTGQKIISENINELIKEGYGQKHATAVAMDLAEKKNNKL